MYTSTMEMHSWLFFIVKTAFVGRKKVLVQGYDYRFIVLLSFSREGYSESKYYYRNIRHVLL